MNIMNCILIASAVFLFMEDGATALSFALRSAKKAGIRIAPATNPNMGLGAYATEPIPCFTKLATFEGELLTIEQVLTRFRNAKGYEKQEQDLQWESSRKSRNQGITGAYLFDLGNGHYIDGE